MSAGGPKPAEPAKAFEQILAKYQLYNPSPELAAYREAFRIVRDHNEKYRPPSKMEQELRAAGFRATQTEINSYRLRFPSPDAYLNTVLIGWCYNQTEYTALPAESQKNFLEEALRTLREFIATEGFAFDTQITHYRAAK